MIGGAQLSPQGKVAYKCIERQIYVIVVVGVEVPTFLVAMDSMAHGIEIDDDFLCMFGQASGAQFQQQRLDQLWVVGEFVSATGFVVG